jgi:hypothetical protein
LLDEVFGQAVVYHGFADYMRDYEIYLYCTADPRTGITPETVRLSFRNCVVADIRTALPAKTWAGSLDERLIDYESGVDLDGYVWGVKWHEMYPGGKLVEASDAASEWSEALGLLFHEARITTNAHTIRLVFTELVSTVVEPGYSPFTVTRSGPDFKIPLG